MHRKVGNGFYLKVPKLANLADKNREKPEIITSSLYKKCAVGSRKENLYRQRSNQT